MKIGEWDDIGRSRALVQRLLGELRTHELATHVVINPDTRRQRILLAADVGLFDFNYGTDGAGTGVTWTLRGALTRWASVRGFRIQADAQYNEADGTAKSVWHIVCEDPRIELVAATADEPSPVADALIDFARACLAALEPGSAST
jgi:hypothetical protein